MFGFKCVFYLVTVTSFFYLVTVTSFFIETQTRVEIIYNNHNWDRVKVFDFVFKFMDTKNGLAIQLSTEDVILCNQLVSVDIKRIRVDRCGIDAAANPCGDASEY